MIEGQLKEKKGGKWKIFKKWKSRYFTLSGAKLSYKDSVSYMIFENVNLVILLNYHTEDVNITTSQPPYSLRKRVKRLTIMHSTSM